MAGLTPALKAAITRFDTAAQNLAFVGAADLEDRHAILHQHERARESLKKLIERAIGGS